METASCPILNTFRFSINNSSKLYIVPTKSLSFLPPKNYLSTTSSIGKLYSDGCFVNSSSSFSSSTQDTPPQQLALFLEVEGITQVGYGDKTERPFPEDHPLKKDKKKSSSDGPLAI